MAAFSAVITFQMLSGGIKTQGILNDKSVGGGRGVSPARVQLLLITMAFAFYVLSQVLESVSAGQGRFPDFDVKWLLLLGGSHSVFLGTKSISMLWPQSKSKEGD